MHVCPYDLELCQFPSLIIDGCCNSQVHFLNVLLTFVVDSLKTQCVFTIDFSLQLSVLAALIPECIY